EQIGQIHFVDDLFKYFLDTDDLHVADLEKDEKERCSDEMKKRDVLDYTEKNLNCEKDEIIEEASTLDRFPDEVLMKIISYLPVRDLILLRAVSRRLKRLTEFIITRIPKTLVVTKDTLIHSIMYTGMLFPNICTLVIDNEQSAVSTSPPSLSLKLADVFGVMKGKLNTIKRLIIRGNDYSYGDGMCKYIKSLETLKLESLELPNPFLNPILNSCKQLRKITFKRLKASEVPENSKIDSVQNRNLYFLFACNNIQ
ncbi:hypothetical protein B4U79_18711, partial [Dinothrombium tinctorium]